MSQKVVSEVTRPVSCRRPRGACRPEGGNRRLPVLHLTLLALHPWALDVTLTLAPAPGAPKHQISAPGAIFPQNTNFLNYTTTPIASVYLCDWLPWQRDIISICRSISLSKKSTNTSEMKSTPSRESGALLMAGLQSTAISNSQSSAQRARQRDGQRGGREGRVEGVPEAMTSVFQV